MEKYEELIALVTEALSIGLSKQSDIIRYCNDSIRVSEHRVRRVLKGYSEPGQNQKWTVAKVPGMNMLNYSLLPERNRSISRPLLA